MKKLALFVATLAALNAASVLADTTTTPTTNTNTNTSAAAAAVAKSPEDVAREACTTKGLAGALLDECVKTELAKATEKKAE